MRIEDIIKTKKKLSLSKQVILNIFYTQKQFKDAVLEVLKPLDLSIEQLNVLRILRGKNKQPTSLKDLHDRMLTKMSNTTRLVDKLILKGYVKKSRDLNNKRKIEIIITDKGLQILANLDPLIDTAEYILAKNLTPKEQKQFIFLIEKMRS